MMMSLGGRVHGEIRVPGDKSVSHRALLFAALADGTSEVRGLSDAADVRSTAGVLRALGAHVPPLGGSTSGPTRLRIQGVGLRGLNAPSSDLRCGNSGTTTRLVAGVCAAYPFRSRFIGDQSLSRRPMGRIGRPLTAMGARVGFENGDGLPMTVEGGALHGLRWRNETGSAQVKSAILLAGLVGGVPVTVDAPHPSRDHTERFLWALGANVRSAPLEVTLAPTAGLRAFTLEVPGDPSSAAYFAALAAMVDGGSIRLPGVLASPLRTGFFRALVAFGARVETADPAATDVGEDTTTYIVARGSLRGITVAPTDVPSMIDEMPLLGCLAAAAEGETRVTGAAELRVKESDRIATTVSNLCALGVEAAELPDGFAVRGGPVSPRGRVATNGDHRIAMAFGVLRAATGGDIAIDDEQCVEISYPGFWEDLGRVSAR